MNLHTPMVVSSLMSVCRLPTLRLLQKFSFSQQAEVRSVSTQISTIVAKCVLVYWAHGPVLDGLGKSLFLLCIDVSAILI